MARKYAEDADHPDNLVVLLDDWKECVKESQKCEPPVPDIRYDLNQLTILEANPLTLTYSEVGVIDEEEEARRASKKKGPKAQVVAPLRKVTPLQTSPAPSVKPGKKVLPDSSSPIVIFHDFFRSQNEWQSFAADLASLVRRRVIVVDLRNHGTSPYYTANCGLGEHIADFRHLLRELKVLPSKTTLIGHGVSAWIIMVYCLIYPYKIRNFVAIEANPNDNTEFLTEISNLKVGLGRILTPPHNKSLVSVRIKCAGFLEKYIPDERFRSFIIQNTIVQEVLGKTEKWNARRNEICDSLNSFTKFPNFLRLFSFDKPALFVGSLNSKFLKKKDEAEIRKLFPQAEFVYTGSESTNPHVDLFDDFLDIVTAFLNKDKPV